MLLRTAVLRTTVLRTRRALLALACAGALASGCDCSAPAEPECALASECGSDEACVDGACVPTTSCAGDEDCEADRVCVSARCVPPMTAPDGGPPPARPDGGTGPECAADDQCTDGRCLDGSCCPVESVCGDVCCGSGQTCFANACVTPGAVCVRSTDCAEGEYCEPALGDPPGDPPGPQCLRPPASGRCVALPPECEGTPAPGETCIRDCEFTPTCAAAHPDDPSVCVLDAVEQWRWGPVADYRPDDTDVWGTPVVGRVTDTNCDGSVDLLDPPNLVFVSGNTQRVTLSDGRTTGTCCHCGNDGSGRIRDGCRLGVLRVLDGRTGAELVSVDSPEPGSGGISGVTPALGDVDHDGTTEIVAITYEGKIAIIEGDGTVRALSSDLVERFERGPACVDDDDCPLDSRGRPTYDCVSGVCVTLGFGWGGGVALADVDGDGTVEVGWGRNLFSISEDGRTITRRWIGTGGRGHGHSLSYFADLVGDEDLELLAGNTLYETRLPDGEATPTIVWRRADLRDTFTAVADFDRDGTPEVVHVADGTINILAAATGETLAGPHVVEGTGSGGPPTVADFDGDGVPEIGVALQNFYSVHDVDLAAGTMTQVWATASHDLSSSVTGSTVFDFEGDGVAEVVYNDECFLWVYDGPTGLVRFATPTSSFTGTEASLVADVDGDGQAEMVVIANGADPSRWNCDEAPWNEPDGVRPAWVPPPDDEVAWRGIAVFGDRANSWVGTRPLWNQHSYSVSNVCSADDDACVPSGGHGEIPVRQRANWTVPWLNNYRQNVQADGLFDAPDAAVRVDFDCNRPSPSLVATVRNLGAAVLPEGVEVGFFVDEGGSERELGRATTSTPLFPGQGQTLVQPLPADVALSASHRGVARVLIDPTMPLFQECFADNNEATDVIDGGECIR